MTYDEIHDDAPAKSRSTTRRRLGRALGPVAALAASLLLGSLAHRCAPGAMTFESNELPIALLMPVVAMAITLRGSSDACIDRIRQIHRQQRAAEKTGLAHAERHPPITLRL